MADKKDKVQQQTQNQSTKPVTLADILSTDTPVQTPEYREKEQQYNPTKVGIFNPSQYNDYVTNPDAEDPDLEYKRAANQPITEQIGHTAAKFGTSLLGGALMSAGISADIKEGVNVAIGQEKEYDNAIYNVGEELLQYGEKQFPVYQKTAPNKEDGSFNSAQLSDPAYWMNQVSNVGLSLGIMGVTMAETYGIGALTGGLGLAEEIPLAARKIGALEKIFGVAKNSEKLRNNAMLFGVVNRHVESVMESTQVFQDTYKELIEKGVPEEKARESAANGAALDYKLNMPLAVIDAIMMRTMTYNPITKGSTGIIENMLSKIPNAGLRFAAKLPIESLGELTEEAWQSVASSEGKNRADVMAGVKKDSDFSTRLGDYVTQEGFWDNAIGGAVGGLLMMPGGEAFRHLTESQQSKSLKLQHIDFIKNTSATALELADKIRLADEQNKPLVATQLRRQMGEVQALTGLHLDNLLERTSGFSSYVDNLTNTLDIVNRNDPNEIAEKLGNLDEGTVNHIKQEFPKYIQDATKIEALYNTVKETADPTAIIPIVSRQFHIGVMNEHIAQLTPQIEQLKNEIPDYNNLSSDGKFMFELPNKINALNDAEKKYLYEINNAKTEADKEGSVKALEEIRKMRVTLKNLGDSISSDFDRYNSTDRSIVKSLPKQKQLRSLEKEKVYLEAQLESYRKQLEIWNNPTFQKKNKLGKYRDIIKKASSIEELTALQTRLENNKELSKELEEQITLKKEILKIKEQKKELSNKINNQPIVTVPTTLAETLANPIVAEQTQTTEENEVKTPTQFDNQAQQAAINELLSKVVTTPFGTPASSKQIIPEDIKVSSTHATVEEESLFNEQKDKDLESLFEPKIVTNNTPEYHSAYDKMIADAYKALSIGNKTPTFEDLINAAIEASTREQVDAAFYAIKDSWIRNKFPEAKFDEVYANIFKNAQDILRNLINYSPIGWGVKPVNNTPTNTIIDKENPTGLIEENENGTTFFLHGDKYVTTTSMPKMAFLHRPYQRVLTESEDGNVVFVENVDISEEQKFEENDFTDSTPILNPDSFPAGTVFTMKLAPTPNTLPVAQWNKETWERVDGTSFAKWMENNNVKEGDDKWIAKVPIFIYAEGIDKPIALVHDTEWYNPSNVGLEVEKEQQKSLIIEARRELFALRKAILINNGQLKGKVLPNNKPTGQKWKVKERITINEANPQALVGYATDSNNMSTSQGVIPASQFINGEPPKVGGIYDIRRWRTDTEGNPTYIWLLAETNKVTEQAQNSVLKALEVYLKGDKLTPELIKIRDEVRKITGLDVTNVQELEQYLNHFIKMENGNFGTGNTNEKLANISAHVNANKNMANFTPFITIHKGMVVIGKKGAKMTGSNELMYGIKASPDALIISLLQKLQSKDMIGAFTQNVRKDALLGNKPMAFIDLDGNVSKGENYHDYLKNNFKTDIKSFNVGTKEEPVWATAYQPVINFTWEGRDKAVEQPQPRVQETTEKNNIVPVQSAADKIEAKRAELKAIGIPEAKINEIIAKLTKGDSFKEPTYEKDTDGLVANVSKKLITIDELNTTNKSQLVRFIARKIESIIDAEYKSKVTLTDIHNTVKDSFERIFGQKESQINLLKASFSDIPEMIAELDQQLNNINVVRNNYNALIEEALNKEIYKYTGITSKTKKETDIVNETLEEDDKDQLKEEEQAEVGTEREKDYSKTSLEENSKSSVTYKFKRFLAQLPLFNIDGSVKTGFLGVEEYPGFDYYFNKIGQILTTPSDILEPTFEKMIERMEEYRGKLPFIGELINRLSESDEETKNGFVNGMYLHGTSTNQIIFGERKSKKTIKIFDVNANQKIRVIQDTWYEQFNHSNLVNSNMNETSLNVTNAQKLLDQFNSWDDKNLPKELEIQTWLSKFGITLSPATIREIMAKGYFIEEDSKNKPYSYKKMFRVSATTNGLFGLLAFKLQKLVNLDKQDESTDFIENDELHPLNDVSGVFKKIAHIESKYDTTTSTNSHRDGDKSIYDLTPNKLLSSLVNKLINDSDFRRNKLTITYDSNSYLLNLIDQFESIGGKIALKHIAITSLKEFGSKTYGSTEFNTLSDKDHEFDKVGFFQDMQQGKSVDLKFTINGQEFELPFRMATMLFPTMSDKKTMLNLRMPVLTINKNSFNWETTQEETLDSPEIDNKILGSIQLNLISDLVKEGKATTTIRNDSYHKEFYNGDGIYNTSKGDKVNIKYLGIAKKVGNEIIITDNKGNITKESLDEFGKTEGFDNWEGFLKGQKYSDNFIDGSKPRHIYNIKPAKTLSVLEQLNAPKSNITIVEKNTLTSLNDNTKAFLFSQLIQPELDRIIRHHADAKMASISPDNLINQKDVNKGRQIFHFLPQANNIIFSSSLGNVRLIEYIANHAELLQDPKIYQELLDNIKEQTDAILEQTVSSLVNDKIDIWKKNNFFLLDENNNINNNDKLNQSYLDSFHEKDINNSVQIAAYDYVISNLVSNANMFMIFDGDIANYSQDKAFSKTRFKDGIPYMPLNDSVYEDVSKQIGVNLGKRLAMMIASGKNVACKPNEKYIQLFLADQKTHTTNAKYLIELFYGKNQPKEVTDLLNDLSNEKKYKDSIEKLIDKFPNIADYFDIESTDAQEYTTAKEALDVIFKQGRMSDVDYKKLSDKINLQRRYEKDGKPFPKEALLTDREKMLVFAPVKPVYTDISPNLVENNSRVTYIKSSSFPLLPQFTIGTELDKLRLKMEAIEEQTGHNVRASYGTANKVGSVSKNNELKVWNTNGRFVDDSINVDEITSNLMNEGTTKSAMFLKRENFRIQQDVPFKAGKKSSDSISIGTQMMKEIFGDGISDIQDKIFEIGDKSYSDKELLSHFNKLHVDWITNEKSRLYEDIGVDEFTGRPISMIETSKKLAAILEEEATKRGYPKQDLEALGLEVKDGIAQFIVPLWLSPNSNRYEALLNSIVSNRLTKLKMPGNSFVVGSEAGIKLQEGLGNIDNSRVVYTDKFKGELTAAYTEDGKLIKAQVLVRSTFRNNKGELINLASPKYATRDKETGRLMLKQDMIAEELRNHPSFRIPTSGHVSMSQIEVVGFLPMEMADLLIVPKNFTKQKGLDFDVDKENTYSLWHHTDENGKLVAIAPKENADRKYQSKLLQNEIVRVYSAILSSSDDRIQKKINRVLSMDFARSQADMLEELSNKSNESNTPFTILSDEYQKYKMGLGSAGKTGIGIYSNYVVLHSLIQQSDKPISLMTKVYNATEEKMQRVPLEITIGNYFSNGRLGNLMTLDGSRSIADVNAERQNTATDNEKEQIMGRTNVNDITINVDAILTQLGFDKGTLKDGKEISIPYFLLSQPIIKDYVTEVKNANSITSEFDKDKQQKIIDKLYLKYGGAIFNIEESGLGDIRLLEDNDVQSLRKDLIGQTLYDNLNGKLDNKIQQTVLHLFTQLNDYSDTLSTLQSKLNIQGSGLGKSAFEMLEKYNNPQWFIYNPLIDNIDSLIGDYEVISEENDNIDLTQSDWAEQGYILFDDFVVRPTTPIGAILTNSVKSGQELWSGFFPHSNPVIAKEIEQIITKLGKDSNLREKRKVELKQDIFNEMKKYLFSSEKLGLFNGDPQQDRLRLFFDRGDNQSLAGYLSQLSHNPEFKQILADNKLLSSFTYKLEKENLPSLIKYNNTDSEDFNEEYKYQALIELMDKNIPLPKFNNDETYTTRKLAHDLILYTYLSGGIQRAIEFVKYVPVPYLQEIGFAKTTQEWQQHANNQHSNLWKLMLGFVDHSVKENGWAISRFARQYVQHNPDKVVKISIDNMVKSSIERENGKRTYNITSFEIQNEESPKAFVALYNKDINKGNKYQLYQYDGKKYRRISVLGTFGMDEYQIKNNNAESLVTQLQSKQRKEVDNNAPIKLEKLVLSKIEGKEGLFDINKGILKDSLKQISELNTEDLSANFKAIIALTKLITPYVRNIPFAIEKLDGRGEYRFKDKQESIAIDSSYLNDRNTTDYMVARTILHETVHSITAKELSKYFNKDGTYKVPIDQLPSHVTKLARVFNDVQKKMAKEIAELKDYYAKNLKNDSTLGKESDRLAYGAMNVFEFAAMIMSEPEFQSKMNEFRYKNTDKTLLEAFVDAIKNILEIVGINFRSDSLAVHGIDAVLRLIENTEENMQAKEANNNPPSNPFAKFGISNETSNTDIASIIKEDNLFEEPSIEDWTKELNNTDCIF